MKKNLFLVVFLVLLNFEGKGAQHLYDCNSARPEMAGSHNMILFGDPSDKLYTYHLPLFKGKTNGSTGHVTMHVYQGLWDVGFDDNTELNYELKFNAEKTMANPFPLFSISPRGKSFKVPEMFCENGFETAVLSAYGHVESNPNFPEPVLLTNQLSQLKVNKTIFARRFDQSSLDKLTYFIFGSKKQLFMAHYLTDDENSFDQIIAIESNDEDLMNLVLKNEYVLVSLNLNSNQNLVPIKNDQNIEGLNNKFSIPTKPLGESILVEVKGEKYKVKVTGSIYFNNNGDLKI